MCGIAGVISKGKYGFNKTDQRMLYQLLMVDSVRGVDATGVITCHHNGDFGIMKEASIGTSFIDYFEDSDLDKDLFKNGFAAIGHNRAGTVGKNTDENAHPFVEDKTFAMVHNGTLYNHKKMHDTDVDSHALTIQIKRAFDEEDYIPALEKALKEVHGAYACVWFDQKRKQVGMVRNKERPLCYVETDKAVLFGSEMGMLHWIAGRNGEKVIKSEIVPESTLITFTMDGGGVAVHTPLTLKSSHSTTVIGGSGTIIEQGGSYKNSPFQSFVRKVTATDKGIKVLSKNGFKRLKRDSIGDSIDFIRDDYKPVLTAGAEPTKEYTATSYHMWGRCPSLDFKHVIRCTIDAEDYALSEKELDFIDNWDGFIQDLHHGKDGTVTIFIELVSITTPAGTPIC